MLDFIILNLPILLCLIIGMGLLVVEMCIPGFGLPGFSGVALLIAALYLTWTSAGPLAALGVFIMILALTGIALAIVIRSMRRGKLARSGFVLRDAATKASAGIDHEGASDHASVLIGKSGVTMTTLRPSGMADIGGERLNVVSDGEYIEKGEGVVIDRVEGARIVVKAVQAAT